MRTNLPKLLDLLKLPPLVGNTELRIGKQLKIKRETFFSKFLGEFISNLRLDLNCARVPIIDELCHIICYAKKNPTNFNH